MPGNVPLKLREFIFKTQNLSLTRLVILFLFCLSSRAAATYPTPAEADFTIKNFRFRSGETLPELRIHYRTLGAPRRDKNGIVRNAVLILHGTTGAGTQFLRPEFAGELFGRG